MLILVMTRSVHPTVATFALDFLAPDLPVWRLRHGATVADVHIVLEYVLSYAAREIANRFLAHRRIPSQLRDERASSMVEGTLDTILGVRGLELALGIAPRRRPRKVNGPEMRLSLPAAGYCLTATTIGKQVSNRPILPLVPSSMKLWGRPSKDQTPSLYS